MNSARTPACRWHPVADDSELERQAVSLILDCAGQAIRARGQFHLVLAGGNTPRGIYRALCTGQTDWARWHIYFGDERCLPPDDAARNSVMAAEAWLSHVPIPEASIHIIPAELNAAEAARGYAMTLQKVGDFDLVLLGVGEDGHTASLFPGHDWGVAESSADVLPVFDAPKPPSQRVSLSVRRLARARTVLFLVSGESKRAAVKAWQAGEDLPVAAIGAMRPLAGVDVLVSRSLLAAVPAIE